MKAAATLYTVASIAVLTLMIMRPQVEVSTPAEATIAPEAPTQATTPAPLTTPTADVQQIPAPQTDVSTPAVTAPPTQQPPATQVMEVQGGTPPAVPTTPDTTSTNPEEKKNNASAVNKPQPDANAVPDYAREQRMADEIKDGIMDGKVISLNDGSHDFMAILTPAEHARGAVIILHGRGFHPDWQDVAHPLRTGLAEKGWTTLSLQMPVLEKEAKYYDYVPLFANAGKRIDAGIAFLKQQGIAPIALAAHSCGAHMAMDWVDTKGDGEIVAYIGLGMGATDYQQPLIKPFPLDKMKVPVLDVYGEQEYPQVIDTAPERISMMQKAGNNYSKQMVLPASNHYFTDKGPELNAVITNWLNALPL